MTNKTRKRGQYIIDKFQQSLMPSVTGNSINGLNEDKERRPTIIYWDEPDKLAHGELQNYYDSCARKKLPLRKETAQMTEKRGPDKLNVVNPVQQAGTAIQFTDEVKKFSQEIGVDVVGIARLKKNWVFENHEIKEQNLIVLGNVMNYEETKYAPPSQQCVRSADEVSRTYNKNARDVKTVANWVRDRGWPATAHTGPESESMLFMPAAVEAGLGQLGKHGSLINDEHGSLLRFAIVSTDMPLQMDTERDIGVDDFCMRCQVCVNNCPPDAIFESKQLVRGVEKWFVDFDKCIPYFNETTGCAICIATCPWSLPNTGKRISEKMLRRRLRKASLPLN